MVLAIYFEYLYNIYHYVHWVRLLYSGLGAIYGKGFDTDSSEDTLDEPIVWFEAVRQP